MLLSISEIHEESNSRFLIPWLFPDLTQSSIAHLDYNVSFNEIKASLFNIGALKPLALMGSLLSSFIGIYLVKKFLNWLSLHLD